MNLNKILFILILIIFPFQIYAQGIHGKIKIHKGYLKRDYAVILMYQNGIQTGGTITDTHGRYLIKQLNPGEYDMLVLHSDTDSLKIKSIHILTDKMKKVNGKLNPISDSAYNEAHHIINNTYYH